MNPIRQFILALQMVIFFLGSASAADGRLSSKEQDQLRSSLKESCQKRMNQRMSQNPIPASEASFSVLLSELGFSSEYCECTAKEFTSQVTPALLRPGNDEALEVITKKSAYRCLLPRMKSAFPKFCSGMVRDIAKTSGSSTPTEPISSKVCGCAQADIEVLTDETFPAFATASVQEDQRYKASGELPAPGHHSLLSSMRRCGAEDIKSSLFPAEGK
jgi:hypothetical protein